MTRCETAFAAYGGTGKLIDQAFARRIHHGMIRCYLVKDRLVGFSRQYPRGLAGHPEPTHRSRPKPFPGLPGPPARPLRLPEPTGSSLDLVTATLEH
jgi:hypothetical protein